MATTTAHVKTPLEVYLHTSYHPDVDWIDGEARERNPGQFDHANLQAILLFQLALHAKAWGVRVLPEQRLKVSERRYRVPDLVIIPLRAEREQIISQAPLVCIEILSPDDTVSDYQERVSDYLAMGVKVVWVFDPAKQRAWDISRQGDWIVTRGFLKSDEIELNIAEVFRIAAE